MCTLNHDFIIKFSLLRFSATDNRVYIGNQRQRGAGKISFTLRHNTVKNNLDNVKYFPFSANYLSMLTNVEICNYLNE